MRTLTHLLLLLGIGLFQPIGFAQTFFQLPPNQKVKFSLPFGKKTVVVAGDFLAGEYSILLADGTRGGEKVVSTFKTKISGATIFQEALYFIKANGFNNELCKLDLATLRQELIYTFPYGNVTTLRVLDDRLFIVAPENGNVCAFWSDGSEAGTRKLALLAKGNSVNFSDHFTALDEEFSSFSIYADGGYLFYKVNHRTGHLQSIAAPVSVP